MADVLGHVLDGLCEIPSTRQAVVERVIDAAGHHRSRSIVSVQPSDEQDDLVYVPHELVSVSRVDVGKDVALARVREVYHDDLVVATVHLDGIHRHQEAVVGDVIVVRILLLCCQLAERSQRVHDHDGVGAPDLVRRRLVQADVDGTVDAQELSEVTHDHQVEWVVVGADEQDVRPPTDSYIFNCKQNS